ncbi:hypothetical protein WA026_007328 [Henosepilachna vigintioctopunctata]|uniref:Tyrosine-protein phosphatase non-receptor type 13 n=1 Tax=Henosepilachna vigintioctopunctata TaxID=420089 RepID=A0AAW1ULK2_9CUCU
MGENPQSECINERQEDMSEMINMLKKLDCDECDEEEVQQWMDIDDENPGYQIKQVSEILDLMTNKADSTASTSSTTSSDNEAENIICVSEGFTCLDIALRWFETQAESDQYQISVLENWENTPLYTPCSVSTSPYTRIDSGVFCTHFDSNPPHKYSPGIFIYLAVYGAKLGNVAPSMQRYKVSNDTNQQYCGRRSPNLGDLLTARPSGLTEPEAWAVLCQSVQALQDLFLSDGATNNSCLPLVTPNSLLLSAKGRVNLYQNATYGFIPPPHLSGYLAPEYRPNKHCSDTENEKMWIYSLGETMKRATLTSHAATSRLSIELCRMLADMTRFPASSRASLMNLLDVISEYCKKKQQNRPFSHIVMDLHQEAMAAIELALDTPWGPPAMPELRPRTSHKSESNNTEAIGSISRRWLGMSKSKRTKEASTSMEDMTILPEVQIPGNVRRPKSMCVPDSAYFSKENIYIEVPSNNNNDRYSDFKNLKRGIRTESKISRKCSCDAPCDNFCTKGTRNQLRRNPVQRAASRLYSAGKEIRYNGTTRNCIGPEFVVRASLPNKKLVLPDSKGNARKNVLVILLNGQKLDILCNPNTTTAGQLFELIIQKEHIEENFMLGISALLAGDFVFLPSDTRICKAVQSTSPGTVSDTLTLFMRVRFFLPSLRGIRSAQARHLLYLQLRRSILEHQLPCSYSQLIELDGLAMQAEFGDFSEKEHGTSEYFLLEHYVPETMTCAIDDLNYLREELVKSHRSRSGLDQEKAEEDFIRLTQKLIHYGGHFYTATWILKANNQKEVWLYISAQGINLYERGHTTSNYGPQLYEMFDWKNIQTLCYSKNYLCILPHTNKLCSSKLKKYKLKMDHKKSYFTFRLASLHHQFFLRLRTEYASLQSLSQQFGIPLKDMKNETNSLYKLEALTNPKHMALDSGSVNAETEFKINFRPSSRCSDLSENYQCRRSKSANDFTIIDPKENWHSRYTKEKEDEQALLENCYSALPMVNDKRRGVKMGTRAIGSFGSRISRSMEAVNPKDDYLEEMSLQSVSLHCSSNSIRPSSGELLSPSNEAYILDSTIKSCSNVLPDLHETLSDSLLDKFNNISSTEERVFSTVLVEKDEKGSLGIQITQGSDGNVYIQSVIVGGSAHLTGNILRGDQIVAVDHRNLLGMKYDEALNQLKLTGSTVEFIISRIVPSRRNIHSQSTLRLADTGNARINLSDFNESYLQNLRLENTMNKLRHLSSAPNSPRIHMINEESPLEKHVTESCFDLSNTGKYGKKSKAEVPYHKHIRYEIEPSRYGDKEDSSLSKKISMSCNRLYEGDINMNSNYHSLDRKLLNDLREDNLSRGSVPSIALPRSLGLGRKWKGPVRYPVTPVKKLEQEKYDSYDTNTTSDEEQVFI